MLSRCGAVAALGLLSCLAACVSIPQDVKHTFAPPGPGETSYFVRRPDAPRPEGFAAPAPPTSTSTPTPTSTPAPTPTPAPSAGASP
jgi:hypothetical protein